MCIRDRDNFVKDCMHFPYIPNFDKRYGGLYGSQTDYAVSYTHLDVYKRQPFISLRVEEISAGQLLDGILFKNFFNRLKKAYRALLFAAERSTTESLPPS